MNLRIILLSSCLVLTSFAICQKNISEVNKIKGFYVFVDSSPIGEYESLGEVKVDENDAEIKKSAQYQSVRDNLIKNARAVNYTADGIIIKLVNGGTDKAEIIKFKEGDKNKSRAKVEQYQGIYIFVESKPVSESEYVGTAKKTSAVFSSPQYSSVRDALMKKCKKEFKDFDAIIYKFVDGGTDLADVVKLK